ncbi:MAG: DUF763 domain-containing protein, partial [Chloroflexota bacterium]|nr:DUF763 domain-containing protein [Chloroflexota bacterium]
EVRMDDIHPERLEKIFLSTYEHPPKDFEALLGAPGVGPKSIRALSLLSELLYGDAPSFRDPARFSFAHGGKDGHPYPVDRTTYQHTIDTLRDAVTRAKLGQTDKVKALARLGRLEQPHTSACYRVTANAGKGASGRPPGRSFGRRADPPCTPFELRRSAGPF